MDDSLELINLLSGVATYIVGVGKGSWMIGHIRSSFLHLDLLGQMHPRFLMICTCLLYTSPSPRDLSTSRMPSSA